MADTKISMFNGGTVVAPSSGDIVPYIHNPSTIPENHIFEYDSIFASTAETTAGTETLKAVTPKALKGAGFVPVNLIGSTPHKQLWVGGFRPTLTNGCAASAQLEMGTNKNVYDYLAFDKDTYEYAYANVPMPDDYTGGKIYAKVYWTHPATTTNFNVMWALRAVKISNDDSLDVNTGSGYSIIDTGGTTNDLYISDLSNAITIVGTPIAGDLVHFWVYRAASNASDTLAVDAYLLGVMIWYPVA